MRSYDFKMRDFVTALFQVLWDLLLVLEFECISVSYIELDLISAGIEASKISPLDQLIPRFPYQNISYIFLQLCRYIFHRKFCSDNHVMKVGSGKLFGLVHIRRKIEGNTKVGIMPTASSAEMLTICETYFCSISIFLKHEVQFRENSVMPVWGVTSPCFFFVSRARAFV
jgi:hypothetical protein